MRHKFRNGGVITAYNRLKDKHLTNVILQNIPPVDINKSEYFFIFNQIRSKFIKKLYTLVSYELSMRGIASCFLYKNGQLNSRFPRLVIDGIELSNSLIANNKKGGVTNGQSRQFFFEWSVDFENEKIMARGINFFSLIRSTLRARQKRYNVNFTDEKNEYQFIDLIETCDLLLKYFLFLKDLSKKKNKKVRLVGWEISYIPNSIFRMLCDLLSNDGDIEFIELSRGYISYFGKHHFRESYISISNITEGKTSFGWVISEGEFEEFDYNSIDHQKLLRPATNALSKNINLNMSANKKNVIETINEYRARRKKIYVLFTHLFYDTPINDESPAFNGMCEWIIETINCFQSSEDLLLLKPHPSEDRPDEPQKKPSETLESFLSDNIIPKNVITLKPSLFTIKDLSPFISCGLIWRSSVAMELAFLGIPCIIAGIPYYNILDLYFAKDKKHYFYMIKHSHEIKVTNKQKIDVAKYLYLLERKHIHIDCISYEKNSNKFYWNKKALSRYLKNGNKNLNIVVDKMLV